MENKFVFMFMKMIVLINKEKVFSPVRIGQGLM